MKSVIVGAGGFVGSRLADIMRTEVEGLDELVLLDHVPPQSSSDPRVKVLAGDFADPALMDDAFAGADSVILLAAILGGAAEANYALARKVNVDATLTLFEKLRDLNPKTRVVFASTIAVYGKPMPEVVTDETPAAPSMIYGAQKLMMEVALSNFATRGWLDGLSLRPSGVMARDGADARLKSAFMSRVFYSVMRGEDIVLPVHPHSRTWLASVDAVARNFLHGALLPTDRLGKTRAFTLPALTLSFEELVAALYRRFPGSRSKVTYEPEADLVALFGSYPALRTDAADSLGFIRDRDADDLVAKSLT
ncbi:MAG TPA: NAD-dependent epimerase/dehydratase family protein [Ensifer sp.]|nr:NAD-dependent epimerase/dehydratase family protein [Ensifer sp.]